MASSTRQLPDELMVKIFFNCDGQTFMRCSRACRRFLRITAGMGVDKTRYWYYTVKREIQSSTISQLLLDHPIFIGEQIYRFNNLKEEETSADELLYWPARYDPWFQIYVKWFSGKHLKNRPLTRYNVDGLLNNYVTVIKQTGDLVVSGHHNGAVSIYDYSSDSMRYVTIHLREVTGVALVNLTLTHSFRLSKNTRSNHHHVISVSKGGYLRCYPLAPSNDCDSSATVGMRLIEQDLLSVCVYGSQCVVYSRGLLFVLKLSLPKDVDRKVHSIVDLIASLEITKCHTINCGALGWMHFWAGTITHVDGDSYSFDFYDAAHRNWMWDYSPDFSSILRLEDKKKTRDQLKIQQTFLFKDSVAFFISRAGTIYFTHDLKSLKEIPTLQHFREGVSAISYWGSLLVFGLRNGKIYGYSVPNTSKLDDLDLSDPIFDKHIDPERGNEAIISLNVYNSGSGYSISASTFYNLTVFRWFN